MNQITQNDAEEIRDALNYQPALERENARLRAALLSISATPATVMGACDMQNIANRVLAEMQP